MKMKLEEKIGILIDKIRYRDLIYIMLATISISTMLQILLTFSTESHGIDVEKNLTGIWNIMYSGILSFLTIGSEIRVMGVSRIIVIVEGITGYIVLGIFIAKIVSFKQEKIATATLKIIEKNQVSVWRNNIGESRSNISKLQKKLSYNYPHGSFTDNELNEIKSSFWLAIRIIASNATSILGWLKGKRQEEDIIAHIDEDLCESICATHLITLKRLNHFLNTMNGLKQNFLSNKSKRELKRYFRIVEEMCEFIERRFSIFYARDSSDLVETIGEIRTLLEKIGQREI